MDQITRGRFYKEPDGILAVFPDEKQDSKAGICNGCYAHIGQHGFSHRAYHYRLPKATKAEYQAVAAELQSLGYTLKVLNKE